MQRGGRHWERAINERDLGVLGDPERWGGSADVEIVVPIQSEVWSPQIIRVQCSDLIARSWDLLVQWHFEGFRLGDDITRLGFELTIGVGQASRRMVLDLNAALQGYPSSLVVGAVSNAILPVPWEVQPWGTSYSDGTVTLPWSIPAVALAGRFVLGVLSGGPPNDVAGGIPGPIVGPIPVPVNHRITGSVFAAVSPRAL